MKIFKYLPSILLTIMFVYFPGSDLKGYNIYGGDLSWEQVGTDKYKITLKVYRNCNQTSWGNISLSGFCRKNNNQIFNNTGNIGSGKDITPVCRSTCSSCSSTGCSFSFGIEEHTHTFMVDLSSVTSSCCLIDIYAKQWWGRSINLTNGGARSNFYLKATINRCIKNNSPDFNFKPRMLFCKNEPQFMDFSAFDQDTANPDSLHYELVPPLVSKNKGISYNGKFTYEKPVTYWGFPNKGFTPPKGFNLDSTNGILQFRPDKSEHSVVAVRVSEYRNGKLAGEVTRESNIIVLGCTKNDYPSLSNFKGGVTSRKICANSRFCFNIDITDKNNADSLIIYDYDISGTPGANFTIKQRNWKQYGEFCWTPTSAQVRKEPYSFWVKVRDDGCDVPGIAYKKYEITVRPEFKGKFNDTLLNCGLVRLNGIPNKNQNFIWYDSNGKKIGKEDTVYHKTDTNGYFHYQVYVSDRSCGKMYRDSIKVTNYRSLQVELPGDTTICPYDSLQLNPLVGGAAGSTDYLWEPGSQTTASIFANPDSQETYFKVHVFDNEKCTGSDSILIGNHQKTPVTAGQYPVQCRFSGDLLLSGDPAGGSWSGNGVIPKNNQWYFDPRVSAGKYQLTYSYTDQKNCTYSDNAMVQVVNNPDPDAGNDTTICKNSDPVRLSGIPSPGRWEGTGIQKTRSDWYFQGGTYAKAGKQYFMRYVYKDSNGCTGKDSFLLKVAPDVRVKAGGDLLGCPEGKLLTLNGKPLGGKWKGKGVVRKGIQYYFDPATPGLSGEENDARYIYTDRYGCKHYDTITVYMVPPPEAWFTAGPLTGKLPLTVHFTDKSKGRVQDWFWDFGTQGQSYSTLSDPIFSYTQEGVYNVTLITTDTVTGCSDTVTKYNVIQVNSVVGIDKEKREKSWKVYPNPAVSELHVEIPVGKQINTVKLYNVNGEVVYKKERVRSHAIEISRGNLTSGMYLLRVMDREGNEYSQKIRFER